MHEIDFLSVLFTFTVNDKHKQRQNKNRFKKHNCIKLLNNVIISVHF